MNVEKRTSRLTADITESSHDLLKEAVIKFDSSKGKLIEKMIKNFLGKQDAAVKPAAKRKVFVKPTPLEVDSYMVERGVNNPNEAQNFHDFYESKGWVVGRVKMKDWKAAVRNWLKGSEKKAQGKTSGNLSACEGFING